MAGTRPAMTIHIVPAAGRALIGGEDMAGKEPNQRPTALILQHPPCSRG